MSEFTVAANIIESPSMTRNVPPLPTTTRGDNIQIYANPKNDQIVYCSGRSVVVRSISDPYGPQSFVYRGHNSLVKVAKFAPNGNYIASADETGKLRVWASNTPEKRSKLETQILGGAVKDLDWDSESKKIVIAGDGGGSFHVKCITWDTANNCGEFIGHNKRVTTCTFKPTRPFKIMSGGEDMKTVFYSGPPFKRESEQASSHTNYVNRCAYSPNGEFVVSVGSDKKVVLYDGKTGDVLNTFNDVHAGGIYGLAWHPDSSRIMTCSADKTCKLIEMPSGNVLASTVIGDKLGDMQVGCVYAGKNPVTVSLSGDITVLSSEADFSIVSVITGHQAGITAMACDKTNGSVYTASADGVIRKFGANSTCTFASGGVNNDMVGNVHAGLVSTLNIMGDGSVVSTGFDDTLRFGIDASAAGGGFTFGAVEPVGAQPKYSGSSGSTLIVATSKSLLTVRNGKIVSTKEIKFDPFCVAVSQSETTVCVGGGDNKIHVFECNAESGELNEVKVVEGHTAPIYSLSFSPNGEQIASGDNKEVRVWNTNDWSSLIDGRWQFHASRITTLDWAPSGNYICSSGQDENVFIWSIEKKAKRLQYKFAHKGGVIKASWVEEGKIITAGADGCVCEWMVEKDIAAKFV